MSENENNGNSYVNQFEGMVAGFEAALRAIKKRICCELTNAAVERTAKWAVNLLGPVLVALEAVVDRMDDE